jgi:hypothetical protein
MDMAISFERMMSPRGSGLAEETIADDQGTAGCPTSSGVSLDGVPR